MLQKRTGNEKTQLQKKKKKPNPGEVGKGESKRGNKKRRMIFP